MPVQDPVPAQSAVHSDRSVGAQTAQPLAENETKNLPDTLLKNKIIDQEVHDKIKLENVNTGLSYEEIIANHNYASAVQLARTKAEVHNIPFINLNEVSVSPEAISILPEGVARRYVCFPYDLNKETGQIFVVMKNPLDLTAVAFIEQKTNQKVAPAFGLEKNIVEAINQYYSQSLSTQVTAALKETDKPEDKQRVVDSDEIGKIIREAPIAKIVSTLLDFAIKAKASDIHIEPQEEKTRVRYRIDGILHEKLVLPRTVHEAVISRIKILSRMKIDERRIPQDGRFNYRSGSEEVDLRVSSLPSVHGEKIVMRLLKKTGGVPVLSELGLRGKALQIFNQAIFMPHGIVLVTGPTGSGKTTTLYSAISKINTSRVNIMTLEDPVEYEIAGVSQVQTNPMAGLTFASGLRSFLRQDPDIIMVGEIRDEETAALAIQAALTGHLVFSTLHTNSAAGAIPRLLDMKAESYLLASSMIMVVGQRVVRKICLNCKEEYEPPLEMIENMKRVLGPLFPKDKPLKLSRGRKCANCNDTGYSGRIGIYEVLSIDEKIGRLILERAPASEIEKQARSSGMISMNQDGYLKSLEGITTIEEVMRVSRD